MKCKYCNEEMPERGNFCPICGGDNGFEPEIIIDPDDLMLEMDEMPEHTDAQANPVREEPLEASPALKRARLISVITGCIAGLAVLAVVLFAGISGTFSEDGEGWDVGSWFSWLSPRENDINYKDSYTVKDKKAMKKREDVVATVPSGQLTNGQLQIYYWSQVYEFIQNNGYYLSYYGLDYTKPLDEQENYYKTGTWQQYFLQSALDAWHSNIAFAVMAEQNGYQLEEEYQKELDNMRAEMEAEALQNGFASAEEMLQDSMGPGCTMDDYLEYMRVYYLGYSYFAELYEQIDPTMEEMDAYFQANKNNFYEQGITQKSGYTVDVRHILISIEDYKDVAEPDGQAETEEGEGEQTEGEGETSDLIDGYPQAAWDACLAEANRVLDLWLNGEKTEDSFAELAKEHSADSNAKNGGIYTGVKKGDMLETFDAWCFDVVRQEGDYGIVRTKYGYHIIYFMAKEDIWVTQARAMIISEQAQAIVKNALESHPLEIDFKKIVLGEVEL